MFTSGFQVSQQPPLLTANAPFHSLIFLTLHFFPLTLPSSSMEVNFCVNHHHRTFRLTSPLTISSHRTLFLGCNRSLRPPPPPGSASSILSPNKRRNRLGLLRLHSPRFIFKASFQSNPLIVVVVVVTLSAVSLIHFTLNKRKKNLSQVKLLCTLYSSFSLCFFYNSVPRSYSHFRTV